MQHRCCTTIARPTMLLLHLLRCGCALSPAHMAGCRSDRSSRSSRSGRSRTCYSQMQTKHPEHTHEPKRRCADDAMRSLREQKIPATESINNDYLCIRPNRRIANENARRETQTHAWQRGRRRRPSLSTVSSVLLSCACGLGVNWPLSSERGTGVVAHWWRCQARAGGKTELLQCWMIVQNGSGPNHVIVPMICVCCVRMNTSCMCVCVWFGADRDHDVMQKCYWKTRNHRRTFGSGNNGRRARTLDAVRVKISPPE